MTVVVNRENSDDRSDTSHGGTRALGADRVGSVHDPAAPFHRHPVARPGTSVLIVSLGFDPPDVRKTMRQGDLGVHRVMRGAELEFGRRTPSSLPRGAN